MSVFIGRDAVFMPTVTSAELPAGTFSDGCYLWRAKPGVTSTFAEHVAARALFLDLHADQFWNPWRLEDQAAELERAMTVMEEWHRAEPGFRRKTNRQIDAMTRRWDRESERESARREKDRQANLLRYDAGHEQARLALLEQQCLLAHMTAKVAKLRSGEAFPGMNAQVRAQQVAELDTAVADHRAAVARLTPMVLNPEDVPDRMGFLPRDRRISTLYSYQWRRIKEVRALRVEVAGLDTRVSDAGDRAERSALRARHEVARWRLSKLLAVPRLAAEAMCADCPTPASSHGYGSMSDEWPCPAWPVHGAHLRHVMDNLKVLLRSEAKTTTAAAKVSAPQPLAVVPSGLPITEVMKRLAAIQAEYPDAQVRRGRANRWEVWPAPDTSGLAPAE